MDKVSGMISGFINETHYNPKKVIKYLNFIDKIFRSSAFVGVVGICCFRGSLTNRFIWIAGSFSVLGSIFLYSINQFVAKVQEGKHCKICLEIHDSRETALHQLVMDGKIDAIRSRVAHFDLNHFNDGFTLLHLACLNGNKEIVQLLLDNGANVQPKVEKGAHKGKTALHLAVENGSLEVVKLLVERGADISAKNSLDHDSLEKAKNDRNTEIVEFLETKVKRDVSLNNEDTQNSENKNSNLPAPVEPVIPVIKPDIPVIKPAIPVIKPDIPVIKPAIPVIKPAIPVIKPAIPAIPVAPVIQSVIPAIKPVVPKLEPDELFDLAKQGKLDDLKAQIELGGVDLNQVHIEFRNYTLLHYAAAFGHLDMYKFLVENGANSGKEELNGLIPSELALFNGWDKVAECIKPIAPRVKKESMVKNNTFVWELLSSYSVEYCLGLGANIEGKSIEGKTALHCCVSMGKPEQLESLISQLKSKQLDVRYWINLGNNEGNTPLHIVESIKCVRIGEFAEFIRILVKNGAKFDQVNNANQTPLQKAYFDKHLDIVESMIDCGADIKSLDNDPEHPLIHRLVETMMNSTSENKAKNLHFIKYLIKTHKYSIDRQDAKGQTVLHIIAEKEELSSVVLNDILNLKPNKKIENLLGKTPLLIAQEVLKIKKPNKAIFRTYYKNAKSKVKLLS